MKDLPAWVRQAAVAHWQDKLAKFFPTSKGPTTTELLMFEAGVSVAFSRVLDAAERIYQEEHESDPSDYFFTKKAIEEARDEQRTTSTQERNNSRVRIWVNGVLDDSQDD